MSTTDLSQLSQNASFPEYLSSCQRKFSESDQGSVTEFLGICVFEIAIVSLDSNSKSLRIAFKCSLYLIFYIIYVCVGQHAIAV